MPPSYAVRPRRPTDVGPLIEVLAAQQPLSRYPTRWPLPFPPEDFIVRAGEEGAWVAEVAGRAVGHVAALTVTDDAVGRAWAAATGTPAAGLCSVSTLFVQHTRAGSGIGRALLGTAVGWARDRGRQPVLDVAGTHPPTLDFYRHLGWAEIGRIRHDWLPPDAPDFTLMTLPG